MKKYSLFLYVILSLLIISSACNQSNKTVTPETVGLSSDTLQLAHLKMQEYIDSGKLAGISTLIMKNGETVMRENFGYADIGLENPIEDNTIFRIFSMTKPVTAVALMMLYEEGKFDLDDKVSRFIPEFAETMVYYQGESGAIFLPQEKEMSIRNLLTHTSGITYGWGWGYVDSVYRATEVGNWNATIGDKVKLLASLPLKHQPETKFEYSLSIDVAGYIVEVLSGKPLDEFFRTRIFEPLKMDDTGFFVPEEKHERFSNLYRIDKNEGVLKNSDQFMKRGFLEPVTLFSGGGGLVSSMADYARFCSMMLNGGELDGVRILNKSTVSLIMSNQLPVGVKYRDGFGYGLAGRVNLETGEYDWAGAASTNFWIDPINKMIIITYAQLMPSDHSYAYDFNSIVKRAIIE